MASPTENQEEPGNPGARPFRTALIGLGRIGFKIHGPAIHGHPGFEFVAVVDPIEERRTEVVGRWSTRGYASVEEMLKAENPEVVVIASPTPLHAAHAKLAFAHGAHVMCDKPVATSVSEFDEIIAAANAAGRYFVAYQQARFDPKVIALHDILKRGLLGPIHTIKRSWCSYVRRNDWQSKLANGGGMLNNWSPHCLDELISLLPGRTIRELFCQTRIIASQGDAEDVVKATLVTDDNIILDLDISQACPMHGPFWEVRGLYGSALLHRGSDVWTLRYFDPAEATPPPPPQTGLAAEARSYGAEVLPWKDLEIPVNDYPATDYYELVRRYFGSGENPPVSHADSRLVLELIARCRASANASRA